MVHVSELQDDSWSRLLRKDAGLASEVGRPEALRLLSVASVESRSAPRELRLPREAKALGAVDSLSRCGPSSTRTWGGASHPRKSLGPVRHAIKEVQLLDMRRPADSYFATGHLACGCVCGRGRRLGEALLRASKRWVRVGYGSAFRSKACVVESPQEAEATGAGGIGV